MQNGQKHCELRTLSQVGCVFSVFDNAHHLDARAFAQFEVAPKSAGWRAKNLAREHLVDDGQAWSILIIMAGESPAREQLRACRLEGDTL